MFNLILRAATWYATAALALPKLNIDASQVSLSGVSSGADFVAQYQVAFASSIAGVGVFAGQAPRCAVHRFPNDPIFKGTNPSVPFCDGCPPGQIIGYDHCKRTPSLTENLVAVQALVAYAQNQSEHGTIDPLPHLANKRVFLYRGKSDTTYNKGAVNTTANFFRQLMPKDNVKFHTTTDSPHLMPGIDPYLCWWQEWGGPDNCTFDGAKAVLSWVHGDAALAAGKSVLVGWRVYCALQ